MSDDPNRINPATTNALVQLMLGGVPVGRTGYRSTAGCATSTPPGARAGARARGGAGGAHDRRRVTLRLVNLDPLSARTVVVQGGAYAEHQITTVRPGESDGAAGPRPTTAATAVDHSHFAVRSPSAGAPCGRDEALRQPAHAGVPLGVTGAGQACGCV